MVVAQNLDKANSSHYKEYSVMSQKRNTNEKSILNENIKKIALTTGEKAKINHSFRRWIRKGRFGTCPWYFAPMGGACEHCGDASEYHFD